MTKLLLGEGTILTDQDNVACISLESRKPISEGLIWQLAQWQSTESRSNRTNDPLLRLESNTSLLLTNRRVQ